jgi:hypothetical protein
MSGTAQTRMGDSWKSFVEAISKPGAVVSVDVPNDARTIWSGHSFGSSTQHIAERIATLANAEQQEPTCEHDWSGAKDPLGGLVGVCRKCGKTERCINA